MELDTKVSAWSYQNMDGSNYSLAGADISIPLKNLNFGIFTGIGTSFKKGGTSGIVDLKGAYSFLDGKLNSNFRFRNKIGGQNRSSELRLQPIALSLPISKNTSYYINPYYLYKYSYSSKESSNKFGVYTGITKKLGNTKLFLEGQLYDLKRITKETIGINAGISYNF